MPVCFEFPGPAVHRWAGHILARVAGLSDDDPAARVRPVVARGGIGRLSVQEGV